MRHGWPISGLLDPCLDPIAAPEREFRAVQAHSSQQALARQVDVGQSGGHEGACGVLRQAPVPHLAEAPQALDDSEDVLDSRSHLGLDADVLDEHVVGKRPANPS